MTISCYTVLIPAGYQGPRQGERHTTIMEGTQTPTPPESQVGGMTASLDDIDRGGRHQLGNNRLHLPSSTTPRQLLWKKQRPTEQSFLPTKCYQSATTWKEPNTGPITPKIWIPGSSSSSSDQSPNSIHLSCMPSCTILLLEWSSWWSLPSASDRPAHWHSTARGCNLLCLIACGRMS